MSSMVGSGAGSAPSGVPPNGPREPRAAPGPEAALLLEHLTADRPHPLVHHASGHPSPARVDIPGRGQRGLDGEILRVRIGRVPEEDRLSGQRALTDDGCWRGPRGWGALGQPKAAGRSPSAVMMLASTGDGELDKTFGNGPSVLVVGPVALAVGRGLLLVVAVAGAEVGTNVVSDALAKSLDPQPASPRTRRPLTAAITGRRGVVERGDVTDV